MAGATAIGIFVRRAITKQESADVSAVTVTRPALSMPVVDKIAGFTAIMYDIAANVVRPARNSVFKSVLRSDNLNNEEISVFILGICGAFCA